MASIRLRIIPSMPAGPDRCRNRDPGTYGKHQTKKQNFLVCQQGWIGAEIWTAGPMASIRLKGKNSWYANSVQAPSFSLHDTRWPQRAQKQGQQRSVVAASAPGAQSRVALPRRGCFQALLSGCTILPIISCSSFARFKYLQMAVNMDGPRCTQGGMLVAYLFGISKNPRHFSSSPQGRRLVHHLHSGMS